jgi:hypothetical protein
MHEIKTLETGVTCGMGTTNALTMVSAEAAPRHLVKFIAELEEKDVEKRFMLLE